ncbi:peptide-methionine (S)-S-oxide reductase [Microbulbifer agarilyticus]|uniref:peptide-methionine (S)-S-oxide reductase n=1 Tax=Microbulbifer agarilyticus TaxID=260552 RepID=UPI001C955CE4|nr:peptide-methionine (S)-S-oxide reductase [Microbulbifer agarilyticus]MBY6190429.1 peptide-methionine (S)-S-oxide reductase [Microbulbifer agarilyticus]
MPLENNKTESECIGFGGGCHWCTEAVFQQLRGVERVDQGYIASQPPDSGFSEAVIVHFDPDEISLETLIEVHLYTHSATATHQLRKNYRSAIYFFTEQQREIAQEALRKFQNDFADPLITEVLPCHAFRSSDPQHTNYYSSDPQRPFCQKYIEPKLQLLQRKFLDGLKKRKDSD